MIYAQLDRYGFGDRINSPLMVDKWSLYRLAQYCDELVPDGLGGQEPRFTCNIYLQSAEDAFEHFNKVSWCVSCDNVIGMVIALFVMRIFPKIRISLIRVPMSLMAILSTREPVLEIDIMSLKLRGITRLITIKLNMSLFEMRKQLLKQVKFVF